MNIYASTDTAYITLSVWPNDCFAIRATPKLAKILWRRFCWQNSVDYIFESIGKKSTSNLINWKCGLEWKVPSISSLVTFCCILDPDPLYFLRFLLSSLFQAFTSSIFGSLTSFNLLEWLSTWNTIKGAVKTLLFWFNFLISLLHFLLLPISISFSF